MHTNLTPTVSEWELSDECEIMSLCGLNKVFPQFQAKLIIFSYAYYSTASFHC